MLFADELALMQHAAVEAGKTLVQDFNRRDSLLVSQKGPGDFVSNADKNSEATIIRILREKFPHYAVLGEEGGDYAGQDVQHRWIIDPLDGTTNFLHGIPHWCVTIALEKDKEIVAGVTYDPLRDEMFSSTRNGGMFLNNQPYNVALCSDLETALITAGSDRHDEESFISYSKITDLFRKTRGLVVRSFGSGALALAYVAIGRFDALYCHGGAKPWDVAAGFLFIREAGGIVTDLALQQAHHMQGEAVAANPELHQKIVELIGL